MTDSENLDIRVATESDSLLHKSGTSVEDVDIERLDAEKLQYMITNEWSAPHKNILTETKKTMKMLSSVAIFTVGTMTLRDTIFVLYGRTFNGSSNSIISLSLYFSYMFIGFSSWLTGWIGDKYKFDNTLIISSIIDTILCFICAFSTNFTIFCIFYIISAQTITSIVGGFSTKYLPIKDSKDVMTLYFILRMVACWISIPISSVLAYFTSYQIVYYVSAMASLVATMMSTSIVFNKEDKFKSKQLQFEKIYLKISQYIAENETEKEKENGNGNEIKNEGNNVSLQALISKLGCYWVNCMDYRFPIANKANTVLVINTTAEETSNINNNNNNNNKVVIYSMLMLQNAICLTVEEIFVVWNAVYFVDTFNCNLIIAELFVVLLAVFAPVGMFGIQPLFKKYIKHDSDTLKIYGFSNIYCIFCLIFYFILLVFTCILLPSFLTNDNYLILTTIVYIIYGIAWGCLLMCQEMALVETIPSNDNTGLAAGYRSLLRYNIKALSLLIIGLLWNYINNVFFYFQALLYGISVILMLIIMIQQSFFNS